MPKRFYHATRQPGPPLATFFITTLPMPPPATNDWESVKATAIATNSLLEAANLHGLSHDSVKQRAKRESWPVGRRLVKIAQAAKNHADSQLAKISPRAAVTPVTSTADALTKRLQSDSNDTRLSLSKAALTAAKTFKGMKGSRLIDHAQEFRHFVAGSSTLHGWEEQKGGGLTLNLGIIAGGLG